MKRTPLKRTSGPKRGAGLKRSTKRRYDTERTREFAAAVLLEPREGKRPRRRKCANGCGKVAVDSHHILSKQFIYATCKTAGVNEDDYLWDPRNGMPLCRQCHDAHTAASQRLSRALISQPAWRFIASVDWLTGTVAATEDILRAYR